MCTRFLLIECDTISQGELRRRAKRAKEEGPAKQSPSSCKH